MEAATATGVPAGVSQATPVTGDGPHVRLGTVNLPIYAQPHALVLKRLPKALQGIEGQLDPDNLLASVGDRVYDVLAVFLPALPQHFPRHRFHGYASAEAMADPHTEPDDEFLANTPTIPELIEAFRTAWNVNGLDQAAGQLGKLVDPTMLKPHIKLALARWSENGYSMTSASSPSPSGGSPQTTAPADSGTPGPTSPPTGD